MRYWPSGILGYTLRLSMLSRPVLREGRTEYLRPTSFDSLTHLRNVTPMTKGLPGISILASPPLTYNHSFILPENHAGLSKLEFLVYGRSTNPMLGIRQTTIAGQHL